MIDGEFFRKKLHSIAELSGNERLTSEYISKDLISLNTLKVSKIGGFGVLASSATSGGYLLRADIDALPIGEEHLQINHASQHNGVAHKCGHDGHSTILREVAHEFQSNPSERPFHLLFQPSEENGKGAPAVIKDAQFETISPDFAFGMHNIPGYPLSDVLVKKGIITAAVVTLIIKFKGVSAHASSPEKGQSPIPAITELLAKIDRIQNQKNIDKYLLITTTFIQVGTPSNGTSPGDAQINLTVRCFDNEFLEQICNKITLTVEEIASENKLQFNIDEEDRFDACDNNSEAVDLIIEAANYAGLKVTLLKEPFPFGEDFGAYSRILPSCFFGLGAGIDQAPLHHPDYDFPDELIHPAKQLWNFLINKPLS
ncbi:MAG: amidohydrolase [Bacteroidia bacterium]